MPDLPSENETTRRKRTDGCESDASKVWSAFDRLTGPEHAAVWLPNWGPQAEAFGSRADLLLYGGAAGGGKALALDTLLPTPTGWTTMEQVKVGDQLYDESGAVCAVTAASPVMTDRACYRLRFSDGSTVVADAEHLWLTQTDSERCAVHRCTDEARAMRRATRPLRGTGKRPDLAARNRTTASARRAFFSSVRTTREIAETLLKGQRLNHSVSIAGPLEAEPASLQIAPYLLGVWLGDGTSARAEIITADAEIVQAFESEGFRTSRRGGYGHGVSGGLLVSLRSYGLLGNKHVPAVYLRGSKMQRIALLQGLMDSDGYCDLRGQCEFTGTSRRLAEDVCELVASLGCKAVITEGRAKLRGRDCGPKYRIKFLADFPAFRLERKLRRQKLSGFRETVRRRYIEAVDPVESVPVRCIAVDSPSRMYLCGRAMIPTHNSDLLLGLALTRHARSVIFRRAYVDLAAVEERLVEVLGAREGYRADRKSWRGEGRMLELGALEKPGAEQSWQGRPHDFIGFDEGAQLSAAKVAFVLGWLRSTDAGQRCRAVIASNPPIAGEGDWLVDWFAPWLDPLFPKPAGPGELRWAITRGTETVWVDGPAPITADGETWTPQSRSFIPARLDDNPHLKDSGYRARLQNLPEPLRSQLLNGDFLAGREDHEWQVIPTAWVKAAQARWSADGGRGRPMVSLACDPALGGADVTAIARLHEDGWFAPMVAVKGEACREPADIAALMLKHQKDGCDLSVDGTGGWGSGARALLEANHGLDCASIVFSAGSGARSDDGKFGFRNLRAELWWRFREALDPAGKEAIKLPPDTRLAAELTTPRYRLSRDDVLIEGKDEIRKRIGGSTDLADAVVMAWKRRSASVRRGFELKRPPTRIGGGWMGR